MKKTNNKMQLLLLSVVLLGRLPVRAISRTSIVIRMK